MQLHHAPSTTDRFPRDTTGIPDAVPTPELRLADGDRMRLHIGPVRKVLGADPLRMLAYNGSVPGPTLRVTQGTTITVDVLNEAPLEQTVHWHGLRLENRFDGVPHETQQPIAVGGSFTYQLQFPDAGVYWYHPHIREDYGQEMGLYGSFVVEPADPTYWAPVNRELVLTLDDLLVEDGRIAPFHTTGPTHTMMGRFGNVLLTNGQISPAYPVELGEVVRLHLINTANTRIFDVGLPGTRVKLVGGDSGRVEHERFVDHVVIAPSERVVLDVLFDRSGEVALQHRTTARTATLASFQVGGPPVARSLARAFEGLRDDPELQAERGRLDEHRTREPDKTLLFIGEMDMGHDMGGMDDDADAMDHGTHDATTDDMAGMHHGMDHGIADAADGIEWEDTMPEMNAMSDRSNMSWKLVDADTGDTNHDITWAFRVGDRVKLRLDNTIGSDHQMHHPFHIHGAGRFLVLDRDGAEETNLAWKDTVLVRAGEIVHILFDVTNPGRWMAHCHIAEHAESGMMFSFDVMRRSPDHREVPT